MQMTRSTECCKDIPGCTCAESPPPEKPSDKPPHELKYILPAGSREYQHAASIIFLANELAEMNRLKRLELSNTPNFLGDIEDVIV